MKQLEIKLNMHSGAEKKKRLFGFGMTRRLKDRKKEM